MKREPNSAASRAKRPKTGRRARTPTVLQMEATECGAAALASILGYYGRFVPLEELRVACGVTRDGSKAINILKAARRYGCVAKAFKKDIEPLRRTRMPVIALWNFRHLLVIEGLGKKHVYINDPATGPRTVTYEEFDTAYSGLVLVIEPGPDFQPGGRRPSFYGALARRLSGSKSALGGILLVGLFLVIPGVAVPILLRFFVDDVLVRQSGALLAPLAGGMLLAILIQAVLTWVQQNGLLRLETRLALDMSSRFFWHVLRLPVVFFAQRFGGEIGSRVAINDTVAQLLSRELATNLLNGAMVVFFAVMMWLYDPFLTVVSVLFALVNLAALHGLQRMRTDANQRLLQERGKLVGLSMAGLRNIETFKAMGSESDFFAQWSGYQARVLNAQQQLGLPTQLLSSLPSFLSAVNGVAVLILGSARVIQGHMSLGMLVAFQGLLMSFSGPISRLVNLGAQFQEAKGGLCRLDDVLNYPIGVSEDVEPLPAQPDTDAAMKLTGEVELKGVTFGYSPLDPPLITDLSFKVGPGQRVALVGPTGCGKSTIARLICGLYAPWEGEILFDGKPRSEIPPAVLLNSLAMVDQDIFLFEGTVRENLELWDSSAPEASILQAAKDACIHADITARRHGYETRVEEGGRNFSGGQSQRMEIGRALVNNPTILVLDEASSALDPSSELAIDENLRRRGCACILIAHRLSTIRDCDQIIVLDKGKVVQRGTHNELIRASGPYAELIKE